MADTGNDCIRVIDLIVKSIMQYAGLCTQPGFKDGPFNFNRLNKPDLVGVANNTLFINDSGNNYIRMVDLSSGNMTTLLGGACRDSETGEYDKVPDYNVSQSVFYSNSIHIHTIICDTSMMLDKGKPSEEFFSDSNIKEVCSLHITLCGERTSPYVERNSLIE